MDMWFLSGLNCKALIAGRERCYIILLEGSCLYEWFIICFC